MVGRSYLAVQVICHCEIVLTVTYLFATTAYLIFGAKFVTAMYSTTMLRFSLPCSSTCGLLAAAGDGTNEGEHGKERRIGEIFSWERWDTTVCKRNW